VNVIIIISLYYYPLIFTYGISLYQSRVSAVRDSLFTFERRCEFFFWLDLHYHSTRYDVQWLFLGHKILLYDIISYHMIIFSFIHRKYCNRRKVLKSYSSKWIECFFTEAVMSFKHVKIILQRFRLSDQFSDLI
jgi:hypothetical protein